MFSPPFVTDCNPSHGFLVVTLSSGLASTAAQVRFTFLNRKVFVKSPSGHDQIVENPTQAVSTLASQLPNASIFFLTWTCEVYVLIPYMITHTRD